MFGSNIFAQGLDEWPEDFAGGAVAMEQDDQAQFALPTAARSKREGMSSAVADETEFEQGQYKFLVPIEHDYQAWKDKPMVKDARLQRGAQLLLESGSINDNLSVLSFCQNIVDGYKTEETRWDPRVTVTLTLNEGREYVRQHISLSVYLAAHAMQRVMSGDGETRFDREARLESHYDPQVSQVNPQVELNSLENLGLSPMQCLQVRAYMYAIVGPIGPYEKRTYQKEIREILSVLKGESRIVELNAQQQRGGGGGGSGAGSKRLKSEEDQE